MATKINSDFFGSFSDEDDEPEDKVLDTTKDPEDDDSDKSTDTNDDPEDKTGKSDEVDKDKKDDDSEDKDTESKTDGDDDNDFFTTIIEDQAEKGRLFYDPEKEYEGSGEEIFDEVIEDTLAKKWEDEYVAVIPEEYHSLFTALKAGKSVTEWVEATQPTDYSKIDISNEASQKDVISQHLASTGMDEEDIKDTLQEYEDAGTLEKNGKKALKYLQKGEEGKAKKFEEAIEAEREQATKIQEEEFKKFKSEVLATEELGKRKLTKQEREKLLDHITKPVNKKGESQLVVNQKSREKQLQMAYLDMIGFDFSKLEKQAETKAASGLRAKLSKTTDVNAKNTGGATTKTTTTTNKIVRGPWDSQE